MSFSIDANVLLYSVQEEDPRHERARGFIVRCAERPEAFYLAWPVLMAFVRIATNASLFRNPLSPAKALADVDALLSLPHVRAIGEDEGFWRIFQEDCLAVGARGPMVSDVHVASVLRQHGVKVLYTNDADFRRFEFLKIRNPLE